MPIERVEQNQEILKEYTILFHEELEGMLTCMGTIYSMCCRDNMKLTHIEARIGFWTYVD
jgi:hypothetical protein